MADVRLAEPPTQPPPEATPTRASPPTGGALPLMAHLLRRAGFGATPEELEAFAARPYDEVVEDLVHPERAPDLDEDLLRRYYPHLGANQDNPGVWNGRWFYRMVNSRRPLEEKMALFWHHVFATGWTKSEHTPTMVEHIEMFRAQRPGQLPHPPARPLARPGHDLLAGQLREPQAAPSTRTTAASCSSCSRWASATTPRRTSRTSPAPSPAGRSSSRSRSTRTGTTAPGSSTARTTTTRSEKTFLGPTGRLQRRGHRSRSSSGRRPRPASSGPPPLQLLRRRRAAGAGLERRRRPRTRQAIETLVQAYRESDARHART